MFFLYNIFIIEEEKSYHINFAVLRTFCIGQKSPLDTAQFLKIGGVNTSKKSDKDQSCGFDRILEVPEISKFYDEKDWPYFNNTI